MFENEHDQNWNHMHTDQHLVHLGIVTLNAFACIIIVCLVSGLTRASLFQFVRI